MEDDGLVLASTESICCYHNLALLVIFLVVDGAFVVRSLANKSIYIFTLKQISKFL